MSPKPPASAEPLSPTADYSDFVEPAPAGSLPEITDFEFAISVLDDIDYISQLSAIRALLKRQTEHDNLLEKELKDIEEFARRLTGIASERAIDEWGEHFYTSIYQGAAHSMAAVGMLAPLIEAIFCRTFVGLRRILETKTVPLGCHPRWTWSTEQQWDCHYVYNKNGRREKNLVEGILQLAEAVGLCTYLPTDLKPTLEALFEYRNKMFHLGFEWPASVRRSFHTRMQAWPPDWFSIATSGEKPWIFYLTDTYITHCLTTIDNVLTGVGTFARQQLPATEFPSV
jgi:hypothetical protein